MDLKTKLFENTLYYSNRWQEIKQELGEWDNLVIIQQAKFCACYSIIEDCGLEEEYQAWKAGQKHEQG